MTIQEAIFEKLKGNKVWCYDDKFFLEIAKLSHGSKTEIKREIRNLLNSGDIAVDANNKIYNPFVVKTGLGVFDEEQYKKGIIRGNKNGYAFCEIIDSDEPDYFIAAKNLNGAMNNDTVMIKPISQSFEGKKAEAEVVEIVERGNSQVVGVYYEGTGYCVVQPCDERYSKKILLEKGVSKVTANPGDRVVVKLLTQPNYDGAWATGEIIENLGPEESIEAMVLSLIREHEIIDEFPQEVLDYCKNLQAPDQDQIRKRKDFRNLKIFTIDGADARDLDDAISITTLPNGNYQLGVHIADVGEYVKRNSPVDKEAFRRGTSVYFPAPDTLKDDRIKAVIPMLPEVLSNNLCSLNPHTDKLTLSCMMEVDKKGNILHTDNTYVTESVINTCHRLTYDQVYKVLQGDKEESENLKDIKDDLLTMNKLSKIFSENSKANGALELDLPEAQFVFDENNHVVAVKERELNEAHKLIENFMVAANQTVSKMFCEMDIPFVYRVHEHPSATKMEEAINIIKTCCGKDFGEIPENIDGNYLKQFLNVSDDPIVNQAVNSIILRAMPKAVYSPDCLGHFGLALEYYSHFTSPIRRYPDLTIHRIIKDKLHHKLTSKSIGELESFVQESSDQSSIKEQNADKLEREVDDLWCCEFMRGQIGKEFDVVVSNVKPYGVIVRIPDSAIEGVIKLESLPDKSYIFNEERRLMVGSSTKFSIGDKVHVKLDNVNMFERQIDFGYIKSLSLDDYKDFRAKNKNLKGKMLYTEEKEIKEKEFKPQKQQEKKSNYSKIQKRNKSSRQVKHKSGGRDR